jgi:hypothetical protein
MVIFKIFTAELITYKLKPVLAEEQKLVLLIAQTMNAFLLMNLMKFSRHQRQHLQRQKRHLVRSLLKLFSLVST